MIADFSNVYIVDKKIHAAGENIKDLVIKIRMEKKWNDSYILHRILKIKIRRNNLSKN